MLRRMTDRPDTPPGTILSDDTVPARAPWSARIAGGDRLRLVDLEGQQAIDFLCFGAELREDGQRPRYHASNTIKIPRSIAVGEGSVLYSQFAEPLMTITADTMGARTGIFHDTIFGCCSFDVDRVRYGRTNAECCHRNFERAMAEHGIGPEHVVPNVNFFMAVPVAADGRAEIAESPSVPGDYVDLRAETDVIAVLSNCPEELNPAAGGRPTPIRAIVWRP